MTIIDYGDFKFTVDTSGAKNSELRNQATKLTLEANRRQNMFDKGIISKEAYKAYEQKASFDIAKLYADNIIIAWEGKLRGEDLGEYSSEKAAKLLSESSNAALFIDLVEQVKEVIEKQNELDEAEIKN